MKVVQINSTCGVGSTGAICVGISQLLNEHNVENYILYSSKTNGYPLGISCSEDKNIKIQALKSRIMGNYGFNSKKNTKKIISELERIKPDVVHLHNLHGHDCNLEVLFTYLKKNNVKLAWTFHDCWTFTGYCPHFAMAKCDKWKTECKACPQWKSFSWFFDRSNAMYLKKKQLFEGLNLTVVAPSNWLADRVRESFFKNYPVNVIYNGIDLEVFKPTENTFRDKHGISSSKNIILGVAFDWGVRKGLDVFVELAARLDTDKYQIVLVGTSFEIEKQLPDNIIAIRRTKDQAELAEIYTAANVFVNPTREEVLGLTNIEANACGTPVVTFRTGGSPECIAATSGVVVEKDDVFAMEREIIRICENKPFDVDDCRKRAKQFDKKERFAEYWRLYETINS